MAKQRIIAITGASGGLAQEIVKQLSLSDGIILLGRDKDKLEKCYRHVKNKTCLAIDLRDDNAIKEMVDYLYQRFGRIDVFINNAGFGEFKSYDNYTSQEVRDMFDINTLATMTFSRLIAENGRARLWPYHQYRQHGRKNCDSQLKCLCGNKVCSNWLFRCLAYRAG